MTILVPPIGWGAGGSGITLSFVASATRDDDEVITVPASAAVGDFAVLFDYGDGDGRPPTKVVPTNWIEVKEAVSGSARLLVSRRVLIAGEPGSEKTGMDVFTGNKCILVFRPDAAITTVTASTWDGEVTSGNPASQSVLASGGVAPLVVFGCAAVRAGTVVFSTTSPAFDAEVANSNADMRTGYKIYNTGPADHTVDMNDEGAQNALVSGWLEVA